MRRIALALLLVSSPAFAHTIPVPHTHDAALVAPIALAVVLAVAVGALIFRTRQSSTKTLVP